MDYILYFFLFSFFGCLLEDLYAVYVYRKFVSKQTLLKSPLCPVYGVGAIIMLLTLAPVKSSPVLLFCGGFFAMSSVEYLSAVFYEHFYGVKWWDYSEEKGNFNGKVCIKLSLLWGFMAIAFFYGIYPFAQKIIDGIDTYTKMVLSVLLVSFFVRDYKNTLKEIKKYSKAEKSLADGKFIALKRIKC